MLKRNLNPDLERLRDDGLKNEKSKSKSLEDEAEEMADSLSRLHASFLWHNLKALQKFCIRMSATPSGILHNSWNALAEGLGYEHLQVECVKNTSREDFTLLVLMSYATKENADLGKIVRILKEIQRLDAFTALREDLTALVTKYGRDEDSGFSSMDSTNEPSRLIYPPDFEKLRSLFNHQIPFTMRDLDKKCERTGTAKELDNHRARHREENRVQGATVVKIPKVTPKCNVFITFAEDGAELAKKITQTFRTAQGKRPQIGVLILQEHADKVLQNPEKFVIHYFDKMNYVIPILTEGYMKAISGREFEDTGILTNLDAQYVQFIHDLSNKYYLQNSCLNDKIRCVVPLDKRSILHHRHRKIDPIMKAYVYDKDIEELARRITRTVDDDEK